MTISVDPPTVPADATSVATVTVKLRNPETGQPWSGQQVLLKSSGKGDRFSFVKSTTNDDGVLTATMTSTAAESKTVTAEVGGYYNSATVEFTACKSASFVPVPPTALELSPAGTIAADFNLDGMSDIAFVSGKSIGVALGNSDGRFRNVVGYVAGVNLFGIALGDFNKDGKPDVAVSTFDAAGGNTVLSVLLGKGDGKFDRLVDYAVGPNVRLLDTADYNNDGNLDLVAITNNATVNVFLGNGNGTLQSGIDAPGGTTPVAVMSGDFNTDKKLDLAVIAENGVRILLGSGDGKFQAASTYAADGFNNNGVVADFNGDHRLDLAVADQGGSKVSVLLGNGNGTFGTAVPYPVGGIPFVVTADLDGDGKLDLLTSNSEQSDISLLSGKGDGTFQAATKYLGMDIPSPGRPLAADFNGDGKMDLAVPNANNVYLVLRTACTR
ncbi:FG-GAP-like repeat-containing protein [Pendulispora rubella]|uniref:FG-GAP-like repeat-containing protein n=1 Tax=Pendulispora rubella TaxID=2741070 RepID=A0ABZ2LAH9_9BACT